MRFLLRQGVLWRDFAELAKETYVEIARAEYGIEGRPTNNSRVAMLTGLSRREVARVRDVLLEVVPQDEERTGNRMARILTGWYTDPEFTGPDGKPKPLSPVSFEVLLRCYAGDLPHTAVKKEMLKHGLIEELDGGHLRVLHRDFVYSSLDPVSLSMSLTNSMPSSPRAAWIFSRRSIRGFPTTRQTFGTRRPSGLAPART